VHNELPVIAAFVKRSKRDRYRKILSDPRLHHKFTNQLAHFTDFDPNYRLPQRHNAERIRNPDATAVFTEVDYGPLGSNSHA
jgi:uncharacterized protein YjbK